MPNNNRIWELDALRGAMILFVVFIHFAFDLDYFQGIDLVKNPVFQAIMDHFGVTFVILSGLCVTIGRRSVRRGLMIFGFGMAITAVTAGMYLLGLADRYIIIYFGVLHLLGVCMMLWPLFRRLPVWSWAVLGVAIIGLGWWLAARRFPFPWLTSLGLVTPDFCSSDFFPLFPHLGWFLLGACVGKILYGARKSRLPQAPARWLPVRALCACGRNSLWIYLAHQPVLYLLVSLL